MLSKTVLPKLSNSSSRPRDAILLRHGAFLGKWDFLKKAVDFHVSNFIRHFLDHHPSKQMAVVVWIGVCFRAEEPVAVWVEIDSVRRMQEDTIAGVECVAVWSVGFLLGTDQDSPVVGCVVEALSVFAD